MFHVTGSKVSTEDPLIDWLSLILGFSLGIGVAIIISLFILLICCCCPCCKKGEYYWVLFIDHVCGRDLRSFEIRLEFESAVPIRFDSTVMGRFENFRIGRVCPLLVVVRRLIPLTALSGTVYRLASSMSDHTPVLFNVFEPLRIGMRNL